MLPQVYWTVICEKEIEKILAGGEGVPFASPPAPPYSINHPIKIIVR